MRNIQEMILNENSSEELLPGFAADFPYIATRAELDKYAEPALPWHWHRTAELFYMESGRLEYTTPGGTWVFPAGSGGMVNANVLHASRILPSGEACVSCLHLFEPSLLSGEHGSRMETRYILPLTTAPGLEVIALHPEQPEQAEILQEIRAAFEISASEWGYEFHLRARLTEIWLKLYKLAEPQIASPHGDSGDERIKQLMLYIYKHFQEPISIEVLAESAHISKRVCFRLFHDKLHMTPLAYIQSCRMQMACQLLAATDEPVTEIAYRCGLGSSSYFGKTFQAQFGCSPSAYRKKWHDRDIIWHP